MAPSKYHRQDNNGIFTTIHTEFCLQESGRVTMLEIFPRHAMTIISAAIWWLQITGAGLFFVRRLSLRAASQGELLFVSFGMGLVGVGYSVFLLGIAGALNLLSPAKNQAKITG